MQFIVVIDGHGNSPLLGCQHVHSEGQTPLEADDVTPRNGPGRKRVQNACHTQRDKKGFMALRLLDEVGHAGVGIVHGTKAGEYGHYGDTNHTYPGHALFDRKDAMRGAQQRKWLANPPKSIQKDEPTECGQNSDPSIGDLGKNNGYMVKSDR